MLWKCNSRKSCSFLPGMDYTISVTQNKIRRLPKPYASKCIDYLSMGQKEVFYGYLNQDVSTRTVTFSRCLSTSRAESSVKKIHSSRRFPSLPEQPMNPHLAVQNLSVVPKSQCSICKNCLSMYQTKEGDISIRWQHTHCLTQHGKLPLHWRNTLVRRAFSNVPLYQQCGHYQRALLVVAVHLKTSSLGYSLLNEAIAWHIEPDGQFVYSGDRFLMFMHWMAVSWVSIILQMGSCGGPLLVRRLQSAKVLHQQRG